MLSRSLLCINVVIVLAAVILACGQPQRSIYAQQIEGKVCVVAYNDANRNHVRDAGEAELPDISVDLMVNQNVIIANHVTDGKGPYCFLNLTPQQYTVSFSSPLYTATTNQSFTFMLAPGETATREFGAVLKTTEPEPSGATTGFNIQLTTPVRIGLSAVGALVVMALIAGLGMILFGLFLRR